ncbi:hypothetical protein DAPPUDRAFT_266098 [Daphnia pulex]|uniref:CG-1 domain-containing protein n=1 Tax=Daphnia pulex TaxID=6669 RepID=E9HUH4_DAPPU|nr:hypothetical protein DAPPUDRAFT_266098 [Daphnia pulex]|eukprot:EFX64611.1 hypothetical protein DAPPUDRAFT_266098 [Daphnia pulex]
MAEHSQCSKDVLLFENISTPRYEIEDAKKRPKEAYLPKPGSKFIVKWTDPKYCNDLRADGYLWRQGSGKKKMKTLHNGKSFFKFYFKLRINQGEEAEAFTSEFNKRAYVHEDYPNQVLVIYDGDEKVVNKNYSHGNSTRKEKTDKPYFRTAPSVLETAKSRPNEPPSKVHGDIMDAAPVAMKIQAVEASRDIEKL